MGHKNKQVAQKMAEILLYKPKIDIRCKDPDTGNTVLHCVIQKKCKGTILKRVIDLMQQKARHLLTAKNKHGDTPLHYLVRFISIDYADTGSYIVGSQDDITTKTVSAITTSKENWEENCQGEVPEDISYKKFVNHPATSFLRPIFPRLVRKVLRNKYTCRCRICNELRKRSIERFASHALNNYYQQFDDKSLTARCDKTGRTLIHEFAYIGHLGARNLFSTILKRIDELGAKKELVELLFQKMEMVNLNQSDNQPLQKISGWECIYLSNGRDGTTNACLADLGIKPFYTVASNIKTLEFTLNFLKDHLRTDHADRILHTIDENERNGLFNGDKG